LRNVVSISNIIVMDAVLLSQAELLLWQFWFRSFFFPT